MRVLPEVAMLPNIPHLFVRGFKWKELFQPTIKPPMEPIAANSEA